MDGAKGHVRAVLPRVKGQLAGFPGMGPHAGLDRITWSGPEAGSGRTTWGGAFGLGRPNWWEDERGLASRPVTRGPRAVPFLSEGRGAAEKTGAKVALPGRTGRGRRTGGGGVRVPASLTSAPSPLCGF